MWKERFTCTTSMCIKADECQAGQLFSLGTACPPTHPPTCRPRFCSHVAMSRRVVAAAGTGFFTISTLCGPDCGRGSMHNTQGCTQSEGMHCCWCHLSCGVANSPFNRLRQSKDTGNEKRLSPKSSGLSYIACDQQHTTCRAAGMKFQPTPELLCRQLYPALA